MPSSPTAHSARNASGVNSAGIRFISDVENGKGTVQLQKLLAVISALGLCMFLYSPWSDS